MKTISAGLVLLLVWLAACENDTAEPVLPGNNQIAFSKNNGADPTRPENQDRITDNVWLTRGNDGGQIFNIRVNNVYNKQTSPADTEWAVGTTDNLSNLTFAPFRAAVVPKDVVGKDLVLHLITDDIYLNLRFNSWASNKGGGFSYVRDVVPSQ